MLLAGAMGKGVPGEEGVQAHPAVVLQRAPFTVQLSSALTAVCFLCRGPREAEGWHGGELTYGEEKSHEGHEAARQECQ